jgi:hypothetical protein
MNLEAPRIYLPNEIYILKNELLFVFSVKLCGVQYDDFHVLYRVSIL